MSLEVNGWARITKKPVVKSVGNTKVAEFSVVTNEYIGKNADGEKNEITSFFDMQVWDSAADYLEANADKGDTIAFRGTPRQDRWEKDGQPRSKVYIRVNKFSLHKKVERDE